MAAPASVTATVARPLLLPLSAYSLRLLVVKEISLGVCRPQLWPAFAFGGFLNRLPYQFRDAGFVTHFL